MMTKWGLKAAIVEKFGCQRRFAAKLDVDPSIVSFVVNGRRSLSEDEKRRWESLLKIKIAATRKRL